VGKKHGVLKMAAQSDPRKDWEARDNIVYDKHIDSIKNDWKRWKETRNIFLKFFGFFWLLIKTVYKSILIFLRMCWATERDS
jgi:hypothetical protein